MLNGFGTPLRLFSTDKKIIWWVFEVVQVNGTISYGYVGSSLSHLAEYPVALEISLLLRIWLTQRASTLVAMRPIRLNQLLQLFTPASHEIATAVHTLRRIIFQRKRSASKTA
ncbi:TPA: hypothetical protein EYN98_32425 [Candidatus Poribacteria bacterium]|nr:hypothetical protein [Candidatus Poribacteria bacterium]